MIAFKSNVENKKRVNTIFYSQKKIIQLLKLLLVLKAFEECLD